MLFRSNLLALPQVTGAVAALAEGRLAALVTTVPGAGMDSRELLRALGERLTPSLLPQRVFFTDALPMTPQGKIDRRAAGALLEQRMKGR